MASPAQHGLKWTAVAALRPAVLAEGHEGEWDASARPSAVS